jgi:hypothetical protein
MARGVVFPLVEVFFDGVDYFLADGFHRYHAAEALNLPALPCIVHDGGLDDAIWFSLAANRTNGVRRKAEDVRNAIKRALVHQNAVGKSDFQIGRYIGCADTTVARVRQSLVATSAIPKLKSRVGADGKERVLPQPRTPKPEPEVAAANAAADPTQMDIEDVPGVKPPQAVDRSNDWIHNALKAVVTAMETLPDPATANPVSWTRSSAPPCGMNGPGSFET